MMAICLRMIFREKETINGSMEESTKVNGHPIKCTVKDFFSGVMANSMRVNILKVKKKDLGSFSGVMVRYIRGNGKMGCSMAKE